MSLESISEALSRLAKDTSSLKLSQACKKLRERLVNKSCAIQDVVDELSEFVTNLKDVILLEKYFSGVLLAIVSSKIKLDKIFKDNDLSKVCYDYKRNHLEYCIALSLLSDHPDILQYALKYIEINSVSPFEVYLNLKDSYNDSAKKRRLSDPQQIVTEKHVVTCCYTLLTKLPNELSDKWNWDVFVHTFCFSQEVDIRWMVKECMVILTNMTEAESIKLSMNFKVSNYEDLDIVLNKSEPTALYTIKESFKEVNLDKSNVINIDGIFLPIYDKNNIVKGNLVPVKSTLNNLRSLALAVASGEAMCLLGPVGSGKSSLVEHLASITGRKGVAFKKVQLGDQTDSRMLLGSHQCTDIPGEFVWRPGVLTEAVQNGHWLLLEDIDCAALDVASTLSSLLERNTLSVPGYRDALPVTPGFQLFVTQRTLITNYGFQKKLSGSSALLQKHLTQINVEPLSPSELAEVIQALYPKLSTICPKMIDVYMMFSMGSHDMSLQSTETTKSEKEVSNISMMRGSRLISTRDLIKWCSRAVVGFDVTSPDSALKVLQDALDIFTCSVASPDHRLELAKKVATCLGIVETKAEFYCKHYKPNVSLQPGSLEVGRAKIERKEKSLDNMDFDNKQGVFSFTRQSACLLEKITCCVSSNEPVLLVGETGTGKTTSVQYLAKQTGHKLVVINMNQQSDSADLLGGYKPVELKYVIKPIKAEFEQIFKSFYNVDKNLKFLSHIDACFETESWTALLTLMTQSHKSAVNRLRTESKHKALSKWLKFGTKLAKLEQQVKAASKLTFAFIEGSLVRAMQEGHWVLLDEINLASAEILECLAGLLEDKNESIDLLEKGDKVPIKRHPDFTLFACMNPATDVGKKDLPAGLRNRFTEFFIDELTERNDLILLIGDYLYHMNLSGAVLEAIYSFYTQIKKEAKLNLVDGAGNAPHYSLRTLCRALTAAAKAKCGTVGRSLYESFCLSFLTQLDSSSHPKVEAMVARAVLGKKSITSILNQIIPEPQVLGQNFLLFEGHWIPQGKLDISIPDGYILTPAVRKNLRDIARIISLGRLPVLLQGDTSVGKTSLITYIAKASGNYCVRINNHEHTDLQEYIGSYASDAQGKLVFKEGVLVEAMRKGYWIILDELNLAPSDVLEALNRVLDDNRELFIPETQQVIKADSNFMLFATQNPPGLYGGRKVLSRAFRNRFVELHFDEIPKKELEIILHQRCHIPPAYSKKMIAVMAELQVRRRGSAAVQGKDGFITLRDLFRWGQRYKFASKDALTTDTFYDWDQHIADEGYLVLAGKVRQTEERTIIEEVIEKYIKRKVNPNNLFTLHEATSPVTKPILEILINNRLQEFSHVVWTFNMRRLAVLIAKSFTFNEPVLLVGETGCGKTTICQVLAKIRKTQLLSVNCHMHTESSDFLGGLRPVRQHNDDGRLFEWADGPLIKAMQNGFIFLADEISLADDSVLERLNSLLEPERQLVLAEKGMENNSDIFEITADPSFHFIGTMNPGGDFGKKELSPALRNRFTEIWCDSVSTREDLHAVLEKSVNQGISLGNQQDGSSGVGSRIINFTDWLKRSDATKKYPFSIRDLLTWVHFINTTVENKLLDAPEAYVHGACMTFLDCFGTALTGYIEPTTLQELKKDAINFLLQQIQVIGKEYTETLRNTLSSENAVFTMTSNEERFGIKPFYIQVGSKSHKTDNNFTFKAPTTGLNTLRLLRGLQLNKAILLEGNPGVGKTSLVMALAKASGHKVVRINLSDQTDITDLFGTDLPSQDGGFVFKEGAFLSALQNGDWILLDELNLAPQPVLEGLNACLDHRGEVFIPELGKTFKVKDQTRLFACQNPLKQGGARRGLPVSFLNRFTQVYVETLTKNDLKFIVESQYPTLPHDITHKIVEFNCRIANEISVLQSWGHRGSPWEMNLRDIQRWCDALVEDEKNGLGLSPGKFVDMLYINRMRTMEDKQKMQQIYDQMFAPKYLRSDSSPQFLIDNSKIVIGDVTLKRKTQRDFVDRRAMGSNLLLLRTQLPALKALAQSINMNWLTILVGPTATGKSSIVQVLADLTGNKLQVVPVTSAMDVSDLLGGFEQVDYNRTLETIYDKVENLTIHTVRQIWLDDRREVWRSNQLLSRLHKLKDLYTDFTKNKNVKDEIERFKQKIDQLKLHCDFLLQYNKNCSSTSSAVKEIKAKIASLSSKITRTNSLNIGGKFEWIDSLLVKTLMEGSWLLLDNVNLTSAAVLDRLNGLLEQNGILSIPERGEISDIIPHPNFRIFFTMDTKHGEISRAMRNRGVEIYILGADEDESNISETIPYMDLTALLHSCGISKELHNLCIEAHELMTSFIRGLERPTITQLLKASHLTSQQILRGIPYQVAIVNSFSDVYIKPRCGGDYASTINMSLSEMKNAMLSALCKLIEDDPCKSLESSQVNHTISIKELSLDSSLALAKQNLSIISQEIVGIEPASALSPYLASYFVTYTRFPCSNLPIFFKMISKSLSIKCQDVSQTIGTILNENIHKFTKQFAKKIELYEKFYLESIKLDSIAMLKSNTKVLLFYLELLKCRTALNTPNSGFSAIEYSKAVLSGKITDDFVEYPILKYASQYLEAIDDLLYQAIKSACSTISDETVCEYIKLLEWRNRLLTVCSLPIFTLSKTKTPIFKDEIVPLLYMHSKWLHKYVVNKLTKHFVYFDKNDFIEVFERKVQSMLQHPDQNSNKLQKLFKKFKKTHKVPNVLKDTESYELSKEKANHFNRVTLDLNSPLNRQIDKISNDLYAGNTALLFDQTDKDVVLSAKERVDTISQKESLAVIGLEQKILPLNSYILHMILSLLQNQFFTLVSTYEPKPKITKTSQLKFGLFNQTSDTKDFEDLAHEQYNKLPSTDLINSKELLRLMIDTAKVTKGFPPKLLGAMEIILNLNEELKDFKESNTSIPVVFWDEFYKYMSCSPMNYPQAFFHLCVAEEMDEEVELPVNTKRVSSNMPLMVYYVNQLTGLDEKDADNRKYFGYKNVPLKDCSQYSVKLATVQNMVWKNISTLHSVTTATAQLDAEFEMEKYQKLLTLMDSVARTTSSPPWKEVYENVRSCLTYHSIDLGTEYIYWFEQANEIYKSMKNMRDQMMNNQEKLKLKIYSARLSLLTCLLSVKFIIEISPVDRVEKYRLKVKYTEDDIQTFDALLSAYYMCGLVTGSITGCERFEKASDVEITSYAPGNPKRENLKKVHPYCEILLKMKDDTAKAINKYASGNTFRPEEPTYLSLFKDCKHFSKAVLSNDTLSNLSNGLISASRGLFSIFTKHECHPRTVTTARQIVKEASSWLFSVKSFYKRLEVIYAEAFPDIVKPILASVSQIVYSFTNMLDLVNELLVKCGQRIGFINCAKEMMDYPTIIPGSSKHYDYVNRFIYRYCSTLTFPVSDIYNNKQEELDCLEVFKMNLTELKMYCYALEKTDATSLDAVLTTLDSVVKMWEKQQRDIEDKKRDDDALYVTKSKCEDEDEEVTASKEILEMFPSYAEQDFSDFKPPDLEQKKLPKDKQNVDSNQIKPLINTEDVSLVYNWHSNFVRNMTAAEWLPIPKRLTSFDATSSFLQRYPIFSRIIDGKWEALDAEWEGAASPGLLVLLSEMKNQIEGSESSNQKCDFYRSSWVAETKQCLPLLYLVKDSTKNLLNQWPDFPTLKDIIIIVDRILSFPLTSPVSRFLTGIELLRDKIEEWNKNAHKGNNLIDVSLVVAQQIINWRKLEMSHWKECLNNLYSRQQAEAHKYWFYLYAVVKSFLDENADPENVNATRVISVLKEFMERSNLAEYEVRLNIIYSYHCHLVHLEETERRNQLLSILWNIHNYYSQFSSIIATQIKEKRGPIDKKLRDFVKICSWDRDLSYWSVKDTVDKAHKALHKHTREFEKVLKEPVTPYLVDNTWEVIEHVGIWDRPKRSTGSPNSAGGAYLIDTQNHIILARNVKKYLDQCDQTCNLLSETSLLVKVPNLLNKAKNLCKDTISNSGYTTMVQALDDFVTMVIETSTHLRNLEVESTASKVKQTSQAKSILQQKRKGMADLFRYLTKMGLNYRTGLVILSADEQLYDFDIPPVDFEAAMSYLKNRRCDASLSLLWTGCEKYFQKNIARHKALTAALLTPHQDLGLPNIERCKGFAAHLLKITNAQKRSIAKNSRYLCDLRTLTSSLTSALDLTTDQNITTLSEKVKLLTDFYGHIHISLEQFNVVLESIPEKSLSSVFEPNLDDSLCTTPLTKCYKYSDEWHKLSNQIKSLISTVNKQKTALYKLRNVLPSVIGSNINLPPISQTHVDVTKDAKDTLENMLNEVNVILNEYKLEFKYTSYGAEHPLLKSIVHLSAYIKEVKTKLDELDKPVDIDMEDDEAKEIIKDSEDLTATMLLIIQTLYKKHLPSHKDSCDVLNAIDEIIDDNPKQENEEEDSKDILEDNHLKEHLQEKLSRDMKALQLNMFNRKLYDLIGKYLQNIAMNKNNEVKDVVMRVVPILEQLVLFVQYFVIQKVAAHRVSSKMLSVLLKIFTELNLKGFCKPSDLDAEEGDGGDGPGKLSAGTGLGEGEGQKDVSEKIENQDQLDDARRPGDEKKEEDRDCKEEEKGVNMTDDFDSHLQDVDKKDDVDSDEENENDDADKQMGDTDNAAEKLDQQIWGSEDEEESEQQQENKKEEKGGGESTGEKEMAAKEEEEQRNDDGDEGKDRKKKKDINEMDDPEVDDDQVDPYHGNHPELPEPEDFEMPDEINMSGEDSDGEKDGETETENPFEITKNDMPEEQTDDGDKEQKERNDDGLQVSSDEDDEDQNEASDDKMPESEKDPDKNEEDPTQNEDDTKEEENDDNTGLLDDEVPPEEQQNPESKDDEKEDAPRNPEDIDQEDQTEDKKQEPNPQANPSNNDPSAEDEAENAEMDTGTDDNVQTNPELEKDDNTPKEQSQLQVGEDRQASGRSELDKSEQGHRGERQAAKRASEKERESGPKENKPGQTQRDRTLGDVNEKKHKKLHTLDVDDKDTEEGADNEATEKTADAFEHVKEAKKDDLQTIDAATKEQADEQPTIQQEDEEAEPMKEDDNIAMDNKEDDMQIEEASKELLPENFKDKKEKDESKTGNKNEGAEDPTGETAIEIEGDNVLTMTVPRGNETTYHTKLDPITDQAPPISIEQYMSVREWVCSGSTGHIGVAAEVWRGLWSGVASRARDLTERLRLVLEPTGRSRRAGDFRTGRAINMRRVIPYIASHFRKDRIWLRRSKPARREYKIAIAIDDSSSMADNRSKELAFESLALVSQALNLLESGDLAVLSFGEQPNLLHPFTEQFSEHSGANILEHLLFDQTKTKIAQLLDFCTVLFEEQAVRSDAFNAKLLIIVSDGRGIFSEGETKVIQAVRRARQQGIFLVYVIIDNPDNKDSIMDIRRPLFDPVTNNFSSFVPYLDTFPFPFYLILRDISALPTVLGDALRQWFELAANSVC